jgi:hypothetical protein
MCVLYTLSLNCSRVRRRSFHFAAAIRLLFASQFSSVICSSSFLQQRPGKPVEISGSLGLSRIPRKAYQVVTGRHTPEWAGVGGWVRQRGERGTYDSRSVWRGSVWRGHFGVVPFGVGTLAWALWRDHFGVVTLACVPLAWVTLAWVTLAWSVWRDFYIKFCHWNNLFYFCQTVPM